MFEDIYKTILDVSEGVYKEKGSKFIATAFSVTNEDEVKVCLAELRKKYSDARHHCYAYVIGSDKSAYRINDDGEPSGTAGRPIYGQIQSHDLTNILIVVVRYFGGTLLGVSGLIRAYKTAAKDAIDNAKIIEKTVNDVYKITFEYPLTSPVMKILKDFDAQFLEQKFDMNCYIEFSVRKKNSNSIYDDLKSIEGTHITFVKSV